MSDPSNLSSNVNLEFLRKKAKALLKQCRTGDPAAISRVRAQLPRLAGLDNDRLAAQIKLADVQHALARERGRADWAGLKRDDAPLERFLAAVRAGARKDAQREIAAFPEMAEESIHAACAIGDPDAVADQLDLDPALATADQSGWPPLFYTCGSPLNQVSSRHSAGILECARLLLDRGADPNTHLLTDSDPESKLTASQRAMMSFNMPLMMLLVQRGATLDMAEAAAKMQREQAIISQAFGAFFQRPEIRQMMTERMAELRQQPKGSLWGEDKWWFHLTPAGPGLFVEFWRSLLRSGYNPNRTGPDGQTILHHIAQTGTAAVAELFLSYGADPNRLTPDGRTALVLAIRAGNIWVAGELRARAASDAGLRPIDELIGACVRVDRWAGEPAAHEVREILKSNPGILNQMSSEDFEVLVRAAARNSLDQVRLMAQSGFNLSALGESGATALHVAAWHGHVEMVRLLLEFHAPVNVRDTTFGSSPLAWAACGSRTARNPDDDYCAIVNVLIDAGSDYATSVNRSGVSPDSLAGPRVAALLKERRFIRGNHER